MDRNITIGILVLAVIILSLFSFNYHNAMEGCRVEFKEYNYLLWENSQVISANNKLIKDYQLQIINLNKEVKLLEDETFYWRGEASVSGEAERFFKSIEELQEWLIADLTNEHEFMYDSYDCDDFAFDLAISAISDGYWIGLASTKNHMFNFVIIGNNVYMIEPQTDEITEWGTLD